MRSLWGAGIAALMMGAEVDARTTRTPKPISPLTGKQPLAQPKSNRNADLLRKSLARSKDTTK